MTYYSGFVCAVPSASKHDYIAHATKAWPMFQKRGALRMVETWGEDVPHGTQTDFWRATRAQDSEVPVFSWIEWPDRATCDAAWADMMQDPDMAQMGDMPFDGQRMFWGGFQPVFTAGDDRRVGYVQGFVLAVPADRQQAYARMAAEAWPMFQDLGCLAIVEGWGVDVPHGTQTDFYRAAAAKDDEVPVFSWMIWPDRASCDAAAAKMQAQVEAHPMTDMPFDGARMFWGGFVPVVDTAQGTSAAARAGGSEG